MLACGRTELVAVRVVSGDAGVVAAVGSRADAGLDAGQAPCLSAPFGVDCCLDGRRVTSASCVDGQAVCSSGAICACEGVAQSFLCVDFCGTDAFAGPACVNGAWRCASGLRPTTDCPDDTCWGDPGECCQQPRCVAGQWACGSVSC